MTTRHLLYLGRSVNRPAPARRHAVLALGLGFVALAATAQNTASVPGRQVLLGHVPKAVATSVPIAPMAASNRLNLTICLPLRNGQALPALIDQLYDPNSPLYRQYLTPDGFTDAFGPTEADYQAIIAFAGAQGFTVKGTHPNRTLLNVNASVADIERVFQVKMGIYQHPTEPRTYYAPDREPSVATPVPLLFIGGLNNFNLPHPMNLLREGRDRRTNGVAQATGSGPGGLFMGRDFRAAYAPNVPLTGAGQVLGLLEFDGFFPADITEYERIASLPAVPLETVLLDGFNGAPGPANVEVALDIEMGVSMAPGLSKIIIYEGLDEYSILNRMATDNQAKQLSASWTFGFSFDPVRDQIFQQYAAQGQSYFNASGDSGAYPRDPAAPVGSPYITVVGGTSLVTRGPGGPWESETAWTGSGGGTSSVYPIPTWQQPVSMANNQGSTTFRNVPDVAALADVLIFLVSDNGSAGAVGGTSAACPLWAAFTALVNQQAAATCQPTVGFINPAIYAIGLGPNYTNSLHDITVGGNTNAASPLKFHTAVGYDLVTGWGSPVGVSLVSALTQNLPTSPLLAPIIAPPSGANLLASLGQPVYVSLLGTSNATVKATIPGIASLTFLDNGRPPDLISNDDVYSALLNVPATNGVITMTVMASAPGKISTTNIVYYNILPQPLNDNFTNATKVPAAGAIFLSNNRTATTEPNEPSHDGILSSSASLWWTWLAPVTTNVLIDTVGSKVETILAVYTGNVLSNLTQVGATNSNLAQAQPAYVGFTAQAGQSYQIAVAAFDTNSTGSLKLRVTPGGQPDTTSPTVFVSSPQSGLATTNSLLFFNGTAFDPGPNQTGVSQILVTDNGCGAGSVSGTTNWSGPTLLSQGLNILQVYSVDEAGNRSSPVTVEITYVLISPANDLFVNAIALTNLSGQVSAFTTNATREVGEPAHAGNPGGHSVWWSFTAPSDGVLSLNTGGSSFDTLLGLYTGTVVSNLTTIANNDDAYPGIPGGVSAIDAAVRSNQTYYVAVDGYFGAAGTAVLHYSFAPATVFSLTTSATSGGSVLLSFTNSFGGVATLPSPSADFASNTTVVVTGVPLPNYQLNTWTSDVVSIVNPLNLVLATNVNLIAEFGPMSFTDGFESGDLSELPWTTSGNAPWFVQTNVVSAGQYAARSGVIGDSQSSTLTLTTSFGGGTGAFDVRVSSEPQFDVLNFSIDGQLQQQWSGEAAWGNYQFPLPGGTHTLTWSYVKDASLSMGLDAAFIDNVSLPLRLGTNSMSAASLSIQQQTDGSFSITLLGQTNQTYVFQGSTNLVNWMSLLTNVATGGYIRIPDPTHGTNSLLFYRAYVPQ